MAKSHFHASPVILGAGLVVVMVFAIIVGVNQLNSNQDIRSKAEGLVGNVQPQTGTQNPEDTKSSGCTLYVNDPYTSGNSVYSYSYVTCTKNYSSMNMCGQIYIDGIGPTGGICQANPACANCSILAGTAKTTLKSGKHTYCSWFTTNEYGTTQYTQGPKRSNNCITVTH